MVVSGGPIKGGIGSIYPPRNSIYKRYILPNWGIDSMPPNYHLLLKVPKKNNHWFNNRPPPGDFPPAFDASKACSARWITSARVLDALEPSVSSVAQARHTPRKGEENHRERVVFIYPRKVVSRETGWLLNRNYCQQKEGRENSKICFNIGVVRNWVRGNILAQLATIRWVTFFFMLKLRCSVTRRG